MPEFVIHGWSWGVDGPVWSDEDKAEFAKIVAAVERRVESFPAVRCRGEETTEYRKDDGRWEAQPLPTRFEVWLGRTWGEPKYRIDYEPRVMRWIDGAAPFSIESESEVCDGESVSTLGHENGRDRFVLRSTPAERHAGLPGMGSLRHLLGRSTYSDPNRPGSASRCAIEHYVRLAVSGSFVNNAARGDSLTLADEEREGVAALRVELVLGGRQRQRWWLDPARGYALLGRDLAFADGDGWQPRYVERIPALQEIAKGIWFPKEVRFSRFSRDGTPQNRGVRRFESVDAAGPLPDGFFTVEAVNAALLAKKLSGAGLQAQMVEPAEQETSSMGVRLTRKEDGAALANVSLSINRSGEEWSITTDAEGRWRYDAAPQDLEGLLVRLEHPDYLDDTHFGNFCYRSLQDYDSLRDGRAVLVMKRGSRVAGRVVDGEGKPVGGALVRMGRDRWGSHHPATRTGSDGPFEIAHGKLEERVYFTVEADGYAPGLKVLEGVEAGGEVWCDFTLSRAKELRVQLVDEAGEPVEGVRAVADTWREARTLTYQANSDPEGRFVWKDAPEDEVIFDLMKGGIYLRDLALRASENEQTVVFRPALRVLGTVVDAKTGEPVQEFRVVPGRKAHDDDVDIYWREDQGQTSFEGAFERTGSTLGWRYFFRIEADGYETVISEPIRAKAQTEYLKFRLE